MRYPELAPYGWNDRWAALFSSEIDNQATGLPLVPGRVLRHDGTALLTRLPGGVQPLPLGRSIDPPPEVGDWVVAADEGGRVLAVLPRSALLARRAAHGDEVQPLAANVDVVLIACGLDRPVKPGRIDRAITLTWDAGATPLVVLTKADLASDIDQVIDEVTATHPGVDVVATSARDRSGIGQLSTRLVDRTAVLLGESGAGKSMLTNALLDDEVAASGDVRKGDAKGRHTTTARQAHLLAGNGLLIDTPGIRAVGLWADPEAVGATFADLEDLAVACRFTDCSHDSEPGCAVREAVDEGTLVAERLDAWRALQREAAASRRRADPRLNRQFGKHMARVTKDAQRRKARGTG